MIATPDQDARDQALDTTTSFIVQAPAGSGKTELLIQRYLALLARVQTPEAVVAITFTKKAAAEMASRVMKALRQGAEPAGSPQQERTRQLALNVLAQNDRLDWRLLDNPARLQVQTIDALCLRIVSRMPWVARLGALPAFTEQPEPLYLEAARETLRLLEHEDPRAQAIAALLLHRDNDIANVAGLIAQMLDRREQWLRHTGVEPDLELVRERLEDSIRGLVETSLAHLDEIFHRDLLGEAANLAKCTGSPRPRAEDLPQWTAIGRMLLTNEGQWRASVDARLGFRPKSVEKSRWEGLLHQLRGNEQLRDALAQVRNLPPYRYTDAQWRILSAVIEILPVAVAQLQILFRERGQMDFTELSLSALRALGEKQNPTDLALTLGYSIEHILVDEFQDTSETQFELLKRLTAGWVPGDGRTLFLVGDPMQSIYRFRQAEVGLFLRAKIQGVGPTRLETLTLRTNFRSDPAIVDWVNGAFRGIFPAIEDPNRGAVGYCESQSTRPLRGGKVAVHALLDDNGTAESQHILEIIRAAPEDSRIAILARARAHLPDIVSLLRRERIPFQAVELHALGERPVIQDLLALTFALLHLADRVSWLAILRAPYCGLLLTDLEAIAGGHPNAAIWDVLQRDNLRISEDGFVRVKRIRPILEKALRERGSRGLRSIVEDAWRALGAPYCLEEQVDLEDAAAYFDLLEEVEEGGDLADFGALRLRVKELFARPDTRAGDRLQLMTIHKAKGLEFDIAILPGLHRPPKRDDGGLLEWLEEGDRLLLAPISETRGQQDAIYRYVRDRDHEKERNEVRRLLYVAATRARRELYLLGNLNTRQKHGNLEMTTPGEDKFLGLLWPTVANAFRERFEERLSVALPTLPPNPRLLRRVPEGWNTPSPPDPVKWDRQEQQLLASEEITFDWVGDTLRYIGIVLHAFLQRIAREGVRRWDSAAVIRHRNAFRTALENLGVPSNEVDEAVERVERALTECLSTERGQWILSAHREAQSEFALSGFVEGRFIQTRIDRTFVDEHGVRWIIDYKTSAHEGGRREAFLDNERERYREQLGRYARLISFEDRRPVKLGLYFPLMNGWREWEATTKAPCVARQASLFEDY